MAIKLIYNLDMSRFRPLIICDYCGKEIKKYSDGNYAWSWEDNKGKGMIDIKFLHSKCDENARSEWGIKYPELWGEIGDFLVYLKHNLKFFDKKEKEHIKKMKLIENFLI